MFVALLGGFEIDKKTKQLYVERENGDFASFLVKRERIVRIGSNWEAFAYWEEDVSGAYALTLLMTGILEKYCETNRTGDMVFYDMVRALHLPPHSWDHKRSVLFESRINVFDIPGVPNTSYEFYCEHGELNMMSKEEIQWH